MAQYVSDQPECPKCGMIMLLARIEPQHDGKELRTFECSLCEHQGSILAKSVTSKQSIQTR